MCVNHAKKLNFYTEFVKLGLTLTHLILYYYYRQEKNMGDKIPQAPLSPVLEKAVTQ